MFSLLRKVGWLLRRRAKQRDLEAELQFHLDEEADERQLDGLNADAARRAARLQFGGVALVQEDTRAAWSGLVVEQFWQDLCYAARSFRRTPAFTGGAIAVLAVGIGANLALLQIFDAVIVHRYTFDNADSFVRFERLSKDGIVRTFGWSDVGFYREKSTSFTSLVAEDKSFTAIVDAAAEQRVTFVSDNYFNAVSIAPALGRVFGVEDARIDSPPVALLTNQYWRTRLGADLDVVGRVIHVNDVAVQVVGVLPKDFYGFSPQPADFWFLASAGRLLLPGRPTGQAEFFGRLKPGAPVQSGTAELTALTRELSGQQFRPFGLDDRIQAEPVQESLIHFLSTRSPMIVVFVGMVGLILVSACAHIGNMLLVRGLARQHELSIRMAIGAGRDRLIRQLVTENIMLAFLASTAGLILGWIAARLIVSSLNPAIAFQVSIRWQTLAACIAMTFTSVFLFGLPAAREMTRPGFQTSRMRSRFVGNQVAVSCVLLIVTGTLAARARLNASLDLTGDYQQIIIVDPQLFGRQSTPDQTRISLDKLVAALSSLPGVERATVATAVPLRGRIVDNFPHWPRVQRSAVSSEYFAVMNQSLLRGRTFLPGETDVVIASESAERALWPSENGLGQTWTVAGRKRTVVGVVQDSWAPDFNPGTIEAYLPISAADLDRSLVIVRTTGNTESVIGLIARTAAKVDQTVLAVSLNSMLEAIRQAGTGPGTKIVGALGLVATALAAAGIFALIAFTVMQRTREIGIRIAIGATPRDIVIGLLSVDARPLFAGLFKGAIGGIILLLFIRAVVLPERYIVIAGGLTLGLLAFSLVAAVAVFIPAVRALRIDVSKALRTD